MPKRTTPIPARPHANANQWNRYFVNGIQQSSEAAAKCCKTVSCPRCRAAKGWACFSASGNDSSTPHAARWEVFREAQSPEVQQAKGSTTNR